MGARDLGLGLFFLGLFALLAQAVYSLLREADVPPLVRFGLLALFAGVVVLLASLVRERLGEVREE